MTTENTSAAVQRYLHALDGEAPAEPIIRDLLDRSVRRLYRLSVSLLHRNYPRLTRPPLNLQADELLSAVVERLIKTLHDARPANVRHFFAMAGQHARWELNDLARRLDEQPIAVELHEGLAPAPVGSGSALSLEARRILEAIAALPADEQEAFDLVHVQGLTHGEAATLLGVATKTVQRRLDRGLRQLTEVLGDLCPMDTPPDSA